MLSYKDKLLGFNKVDQEDDDEHNEMEKEDSIIKDDE